ncbi:hypothetical protein CGZ91_10805 [Parenemella sanctibonifatiensis]|uniref:Gfo/Idh/MocA family oxidoreductase n=2 Tax=Parenemella sanctibonifatiensis TaxID=2016505 RepID=A0A255ECV9_9ACTN|nr:hypothetical protein CGZ91_10805 [Parenemella sanctibonifatiensis]
MRSGKTGWIGFCDSDAASKVSPPGKNSRLQEPASTDITPPSPSSDSPVTQTSTRVPAYEPSIRCSSSLISTVMYSSSSSPVPMDDCSSPSGASLSGSSLSGVSSGEAEESGTSGSVVCELEGAWVGVTSTVWVTVGAGAVGAGSACSSLQPAMVTTSAATAATAMEVLRMPTNIVAPFSAAPDGQRTTVWSRRGSHGPRSAVFSGRTLLRTAAGHDEGVEMVGWGIIGAGDVTEVKSGPALSKAAGSRLVTVMRRDEAKLVDYAQRHGVPEWTTDPDEVINHADVDVVYVATPTSTHLQYTIAAARAGKHVLVEKPMASSAQECRLMIDACREAGVKLWVAYYRRTLPRFDIVRELLAQGTVGDVVAARMTWFKPGPREGWRWDPELNPGGEFAETACHTLDLLDQLLGPVTTVHGQHADAVRVAADFGWDNGAIGSGLWVFEAPVAEEEVVLTGTRGELRFSSLAPSAVRITVDGEVSEQSAPEPDHVHQPLVESIVAELGGGPACPATGAAALRTTEVIEQILGS